MSTGNDELRTRMLEATGSILRERGLEGISLRRVADACDTSTQMIYTLFGGKSGLLRALWEEGFDQLAEALDSVDQDLPARERLRALGVGYRKFALNNPALYEAMFARSLEEYRPESADIERETRAFGILLDAVRTCVDEGVYGDLEPRTVADALWTSVHGSVELELSGFYEDEQRARRQFELMLDAIGIGLNQVGQGYSPNA